MSESLRVLIVEDSEDDTLLLLRALRKGNFDPIFVRVDTSPAMEAALDKQSWDIIIADYSMPYFSALEALRLMQERKLDLPFIIVSGTIGEDVAVAAMRAGAHDYIMKGNAARLIPAIERELQDAIERRERRRAEKALHQSQKLESLGLVAGGVAHDFNNLLVAMLGQCSLAIAKLSPDSPARGHVVKCKQAAERAADVTRQMLAYAGRAQFEFQPLNLNTLIRDNLRLLEVAIPKNVELQAELSETLPSIMTDPGQMQQVVMNLIINAAESIGDQSGIVTILTKTQEKDAILDGLWTHMSDLPDRRSYVSLEIRDSGTGMDEGTVSKIFDPFFTTKKDGRGLGLAAVLGIVRGHEGGLQIESEVGKGTNFKLFFPTTVNECLTELKPLDKNGAPPGLILIIDDEASVREAVKDILELEDIQVITAANGRKGIAVYQEQMADLDLVLLDLSMPGLSGEETLCELRKINPDARVILSSGFSQMEIVNRLANSGSIDFLQKPFDAGRLIEIVQQHTNI